MRRFLLLFLVGAFLVGWCSALIAEVPTEVKALLDKESTGQLTAAEKKIVSDYFDAQQLKTPPGTDFEWGPDGYGYTALDQASGGEAYNWYDITGTGTEIWVSYNADDDWFYGITLPFTFSFYGTNYTSCDISANAIISFNSAAPSYSTPVPSTYLRIDPWVYDMYHVADTSRVYYKAFGDSMFVVSFINWRYYNSTYRNNPTYAKTFQVIMRSSGKVKFQYNTLNNIIAGSPYNSGIDDAGSYGLSVGNAFTNGQAITFYPPPAAPGIYLENPIVSPASGGTASTFTYSVIYHNTTNTAPTTKQVWIDGSSYTMTDPGGNYITGVTMTYATTLAGGTHNYYFYFGDGTYTRRAPLAGTFTGPTVYPALSGSYDVGGGNNDFATPVIAATALVAGGVSGPVTFNIYNGTYEGQINLPAVTGVSGTNTVTFQNAVGQSPVITSTAGYGFYITGADYITIQGLTITNCYYHGIYNYYATGIDSSKNNTFARNYIYNVGTAGSYAGISLYYGAECQVLGNRIDGDYYGLYVYYSHRCLIANNMISNTGYYGIYHYYGNYDNYYYNSIYTTTSYGFYRSYGYYVNVKDNIFYQAGSGSLYAYYSYGAPATYYWTSDYNDLYAPAAYVGSYNGSAYQTLALWRTATTLDAASISAAPQFVNAPTNLHIKTYVPSPVDGMGTPLGAVTTDYDGEARNATTPDIGADEFTYTALGYCVELTPVTIAGRAAPTYSTDYTFTVYNCGSTNDVYNLSAVVSSGQTWTHQVRDASGTNVIDSLAVTAGNTGTFIVRVTPGGGALPGQTSTGRVIAASRYGSFRNILSDTSWATTTCAMGGTYDVGGGAMHYATPVAAATALATYGVGAPVTFNIYPGTYDGQINLPAILGVSATNRVAFRSATGTYPIITSTTGYGFYFTGADYITIRNLEITNCYYHGIYMYYSGTDSSKFNYIIKNYIHNVGTYSSYAAIYMYYGADNQIRQNEIDGDYYGIYLGYSHRNLICNNMIYNTQYYAMYNYGSNGNSYFYNSVLNSTAGYYTFYMSSCANSTVKNNIFYQLGTGSKYAYYFSGAVSSYPLTSNYNDLYAPSSTYLAYYNGTNCANLAAWQVAIGQDANSISAAPGFITLTDTPNLHIYTGALSPVDSMATPLPGIVDVDFDGDARDPVHPDIGADEFIISIPGYCVDVEPEVRNSAGMRGDSISYLYQISNCGLRNDIYNLTATVTSGQPWTHTIMNKLGTTVISTISLNSYAVDTFMVRVYVPMSAAAWDSSIARVIAASQNTPGRPNTFADTVLAKTLALVPQYTTPYSENFDTTNGGYVASGTVSWQWGTPTYASGPTSAYSTPYCWGTILASTYNINECTYLTSPLIGLTGSCMLSFFSWFYTEASFDGGNVWISTNAGGDWTMLHPIGGYNHGAVSNPCTGTDSVYAGTETTWTLKSFDLSAYAGRVAQFRWKFGSDASVNYAGWYLDNVSIAGLGCVAGHITLDGTCGVVSNAVVTDNAGHSTNPNGSGDYVLCNITAGTHNITASLNRYYPQTLTGVTVVSNDTTENVNLTLRRFEPTVPTGLVSSLTYLTGAVTLDWDTHSDPCVDEYLLQRRLTGGTWADLATVLVPTTTYGDILPAEGIYQYRIAAADTDVVPPPSQSAWSSEINVSWGHFPPTNCQANGNYDDRIKVSWVAPGANPNPPVEIFYDDGIADAWYGVQWPTGTQDLFAVRFTIPPASGLVPPIEFPYATIMLNDVLPLAQVMVCADAGGVPNIASPLVTVANVFTPVALDWAVADFGDFTLPTTNDFWVVAQFVPNTYSPAIGADATAPDSRSYWYYATAPGVWNLWTAHDWMFRSYLGTGWTDEGSIANRTAEPTSPNPSVYSFSTARGPLSEKELTSINQGAMSHMVPSPIVNTLTTNNSDRTVGSLYETDQVAQYYKIYRDGSLIDTSYSTQYFDIGLVENIDHDYYVTAYFDDNVEGPPSDTATARCNMAPAAPSNFFGTPTPAQDGVIFSWDDPTLNADGTPCVDLTQLSIYRDGGFLANVAPGVETYTDYPPSTTQQYTWSVKAKDEVPNLSAPAQWVGSASPPFWQIPLNWVEINPNQPGGLSGTNTLVTGDDSNGGPFPIGFSFPYYDCMSYNSIRVCTNGWASFTSTVANYVNDPIPTATEPNNLLALYWDDMYVTGGTRGSIWYYYDATNSRFIVEWDSIQTLSYSTSIYTFETILYPNGTIDYMYNTVNLGGGTSSATVGIENATGTVGLQCTYNGSGPLEPVTGLGIRFRTQCAPLDWCVDLAPESQMVIMAPGDSHDYSLSVTNCGLNTDTYDLSTANVPAGWTAAIMDQTGTTVIDSIGPLISLQAGNFIVRLTSPSNASGGAHNVDVMADSRYATVPTGDTVQVSAYICSPFGLPFSENFNHGGTNPPCWTIVDGGSVQNGPGTWHAELEVAPDDYLMITDSDAEGSGATQDEQLITPVINCSGFSGINLEYWHLFDYLSDVAAVDISVNNGPWQNIITYSAYTEGTETHDISTWAANQSNVRIRWHYISSWGWWWMLDDVSIYSTMMPPVTDLVIQVYEQLDEYNYVRLSWSAVSGAAEYKIYKSYDLSSGYTLVDSTANTYWIEPDALVGNTQSYYYVTTDNVARNAGAGAPVLNTQSRGTSPFFDALNQRMQAGKTKSTRTR